MIASTCGLPENTVYIEDINEDANATNPYPVPKDVNTLIRHSVMPQDHLNYTLTWYVVPLIGFMNLFLTSLGHASHFSVYTFDKFIKTQFCLIR